MGKGFYWKLAAGNIQKNRKIYFPYLLASIVTIAMFYMIFSLAQNPDLIQMRGGGVIQATLMLGVGVTGIFAAIFLFYTNSFLMKRRKREFGLFNILGMGKRHLGYVIACETIYILLISLSVGLAIGMLMDKLMFLILLRIFDENVKMGFFIQGSVLLFTAIFFSFIFLLIFINSLRQIRLTNPIELLHSDQKGEKEPKSKWILTLIGCLTLAWGYYIALTTINPLQALTLFFAAVILVIIGTYCLFTAGSITFLKLMRKNKRFYYQPKHFISVSGMMYRMKQNAVGLGNICILSTMVLVMISSTMSLYLGGQDMIQKRYPHPLGVYALQDPSEEMAALGLNEDAVSYPYLEYTVYSKDNALLTGVNTGEYTTLRTFFALTVEDYNRISGNHYVLKDHEILAMNGSEGTVRLAGEEYRIVGQIAEFPYIGDIYAGMVESYIAVVPDWQTLQKLEADNKKAYGANASEIQYYYGINAEFSEETENEILNKIGQIPSVIKVESRFDGVKSFNSIYGGLFFIGIFLGVLFVMATILIIYYKQISEGYEDRTRFEIMQKVGMSHKEVKKAIHSQVLMVFFLPLITAGVHLSFAFPLITRLLKLFSMHNIVLFGMCMLGCFLVFAVFYTIVYSLTAKTYYKIVQ